MLAVVLFTACDGGVAYNIFSVTVALLFVWAWSIWTWSIMIIDFMFFVQL